MCVFLRLLIAHATGKTVHLTDFGKRIDGRKHVGRLRTDLLAVMNDPTAFVVNAYGGKYSLRADVQIGDCDIGRLATYGHATITELARAVAAALPEAKIRLKEQRVAVQVPGMTASWCAS
jgi:hypothetical protein